MSLANMKILVLDDMSTMRKLVGRALKEMGVTNITEAADGVLGWTACSEASPTFDLIVSDWNMPNATGLDLLKRVRADGRFKNTPFILLTAESEASQVAEALKFGVNAYVVKPFTPENFKAKIMEVMEKAKKAA